MADAVLSKAAEDLVKGCGWAWHARGHLVDAYTEQASLRGGRREATRMG
jgi:hypothetical protein